jgi:peptidoglycan hydrolase CwlO-like protein
MALPKWWPQQVSPMAALPVGVAAVLGVILALQTVAAGRLKRELASAQQEIESLGQRNLDLGQELDRAQSDRRRLGEQLDSLRKQFASVSEELEGARQRTSALEGEFEQVRTERVELQARLATLTEERNDAVQSAKRLEEEKEELQRTAGNLRERLTLLKRDYGQLADQLEPRSLLGTASVASIAGPTSAAAAGGPPLVPPLSQSALELPPIVVRKSHAGMSMPVRGRLLEVNAAHGFVVVDQGSEDGVRPGTVFEVVRGSTRVGQAVAVRVRPHLTACDVMKTQTSGELHVGDSVVERSATP